MTIASQPARRCGRCSWPDAYIVKPSRSRLRVTGKILNIFEWHALRQEVSDRRDSKAVLLRVPPAASRPSAVACPAAKSAENG